MTGTVPTRQRLVDAGMRLFAERGFSATTVGDIESAAGLQPRRGALYKHFPSKHALLDAALRSHLDSAATGAAQLSALDLGPPARSDRALIRQVMFGLGQWFLDEMDRSQTLTLTLEHDGRRLPEVTAEVKASMVDLSYRSAAALISAVAPATKDPDATAILLLGALVALRRTSWTFGSPPLDIDDARALAAWTDLVIAAFEAVPGSSGSQRLDKNR